MAIRECTVTRPSGMRCVLQYDHHSRCVFQQCGWFLLCNNEATTTRSHPILGDVPICERCDKKVEALSRKEENQ